MLLIWCGVAFGQGRGVCVSFIWWSLGCGEGEVDVDAGFGVVWVVWGVAKEEVAVYA